MSLLNRKVLYINLDDHSFEFKSYPDLHDYLGGLALGLKLAEMHRSKNPLIFSVGPLNGMFPYVSKTCILDYSENYPEKLREFYLGGSLSSRIKFAGLDAIVLTGVSREPVFLAVDSKETTFVSSSKDFLSAGLPGRSSKLFFQEKLLLDDYFHTFEDYLGHSFAERNVGGLVIDATVSFNLKDKILYEKKFQELLSKKGELKVLPGANPSCSGCPMGCSKSQVGETSGNVFVHSLVACQHASDIYSDLGVVFSCLNALGYDYTHEELETIPSLVKSLLRNLRNK